MDTLAPLKAGLLLWSYPYNSVKVAPNTGSNKHIVTAVRQG